MLKLGFVSHKAAEYACKNWHYSKCMPVGKLVKIGVWENEVYKGVVIFGRGANNSLGKPFGLKQTECVELVRIALRQHDNPVSKILSIAINVFKKSQPGIKLLISFADNEQGHHGGIYQATNWIYAGKTKSANEYVYQGKRWHGRAFRKSHGSHLDYIDKGLKIVDGSQKHRYLYALDFSIKEMILKLSQPYPKRLKQAMDDSNHHSGGVTPTEPLQMHSGY